MNNNTVTTNIFNPHIIRRLVIGLGLYIIE